MDISENTLLEGLQSDVMGEDGIRWSVYTDDDDRLLVGIDIVPIDSRLSLDVFSMIL